MKKSKLTLKFLLLTASLLTLTNIELAQAAILNQSLILEQWVAQLRDKNTNPKDFREALEKIGEKLAEESMLYLIPKTVKITNPLGERADHTLLAEKPVLFTLLRAGMPLSYGMQRVFPDSSMGFIGIARDETTALAKTSYVAIPTDIYGKVVIIGDTMLGTGGSMEDAINIILRYQPRHIISVCAISAPEGIKRIQKTFGPRVTLISAAVDSHLNDRHYIIPGLGDAGDRAYGPKVTIQ